MSAKGTRIPRTDPKRCGMESNELDREGTFFGPIDALQLRRTNRVRFVDGVAFTTLCQLFFEQLWVDLGASRDIFGFCTSH